MEHCSLDLNAELVNHLHKECQSPRLKADESSVLAVCSAVSALVNPFVVDDGTYSRLISISSCVEASGKAAKDLLSAMAIGEESFRLFLHERLTSNPPLKFFRNPAKKLSLSTFTIEKKKLSGKATKKVADLQVLQADHSVFSRIALIAQTRQMDLREVLRYPLGSLPWSLATQSGALNKTNKATMMHRCKFH